MGEGDPAPTFGHGSQRFGARGRVVGDIENMRTQYGAGNIGFRDEPATELLEENRDFDERAPEAAHVLRQREREPPQVCDVAPVLR
jgi:hypothetical protein